MHVERTKKGFAVKLFSLFISFVMVFSLTPPIAVAWAETGEAPELHPEATQNLQAVSESVLESADGQSSDPNIVTQSGGSNLSVGLHVFGSNALGQLGDGGTTDRNKAFKIDDGVKDVSLGDRHSAYVTISGDLYTFGANGYGQLGDETTINRNEPVKVASDVRCVSLGWYHSAYITNSGDLYTFGSNTFGQLGDKTTTNQSKPVKVASDVKCVSLGSFHSAYVTNSGDLYTFGFNNAGQLGDDTTINRKDPVMVASNVKDVSLGGNRSAYVTTSGDLYTFGQGPLGDGNTDGSEGAQVKIDSDVKSVSNGGASAYIKNSGDLYTFGSNNNGQVGDGSNTTQINPVKIASNVEKVSRSRQHSAYITGSGDLYTFGYNYCGQLGDGTTTDRNTPVKIASNVAHVALGDLHTAYIRKNFIPFRDGNRFSHNNKAEASGFYNITNHKLSEGYLKNLFTNPEVTAADAFSVFTTMISKWEGSCHGLSATMLLLNSGDIDVAKLKPNGSRATYFSELPRPCKNDRLLNAIEFFYLSQCIQVYKNMVVSKTSRAKEATDDELSQFLRKMYDKASSGEVTTLSYGAIVNKPTLSWAHALLVIDVSEGEDGYVFQLHDLNDPYIEDYTLSVSRDFNSFNLTDWKMSVERTAITQDNYEWLELRDASNFTSIGKGVGDFEGQSPQIKRNTQTTLSFKADRPVKVTDADGKTLALQEDGALSGSVQVDDVDYVESGETYELKAQTDAKAPLTVETNAENAEGIFLSYSGSDGCVCVDADGATSAFLSATGEVSISSSSMFNFSIMETLNDTLDYDDLQMASFSGVSSGNVSSSKADGDLLLSSTSDMTDVETTGCRGALVEQQFIGDVPAGETASPSIPDPKPISVAGASVSFKSKSYKYSGKAIKPVPAVKIGDTTLKAGEDFTISYKNNKNAGTATATITGIGSYAGTKSVKFTITKAKQPMTVKAKKKTVKAKMVKKRAQKVTKAITVTNNKGKVSYKNVSKAKIPKKFKVSSKGVITVPKGTKEGTHSMCIKVVAQGNQNFKSGSKTVVVKITVK